MQIMPCSRKKKDRKNVLVQPLFVQRQILNRLFMGGVGGKSRFSPLQNIEEILSRLLWLQILGTLRMERTALL